MQFKRQKPSALQGNINLTSLIDVLCVLVIFFMLTTKYMSYRAIELNLGDGGASIGEPSPGYQQDITVKILGSKEVEVNGLPMEAAALKTYLKPRLLRDPEQPVIITATQNIAVQDMVSTIDQVRLAGGRKFSIMEAE